jgi:hypothetical protein
MDWLDQYLEGLGEYKTTVSPADTHIWGVKPKLNNVQQRMLFDAAAQSELEYRELVREARQDLEENTQGPGEMSQHDIACGIGADPGSYISSQVQVYGVDANNQTLILPGNASIFEFTVGSSVSSFNIVMEGFGTFSLLNNYDVNNFGNCYLSAYNLNNFYITYNPVYVTASESLCSNGQLFTIYYSNTGSAIFSITKSDTVEPAPTPTPSVTPTRTLTPTPTVTTTMTRAPAPSNTPSITPTLTPTPTITRTPTVTPTTTITRTPTLTPTATVTRTPTVTPTPSPAAAFSALLKEDNDALVQENSDYILLEQQ